jgi:hypothetical protein
MTFVWESGKDTIWIVMEYADCGDLTDLIDRVTLREDHMATLCREVSAIQYFYRLECLFDSAVSEAITDGSRLLKDFGICIPTTSSIGM